MKSNSILFIFRQKLETNNVSLENVIVKENDSIVVGTVKVKNVSFHKEVIVRTTWDDWKSQEDIFCTYSPVRMQMIFLIFINKNILFIYLWN